MPYIDLMSADDYASIWYTTNSRFGNVGSFDPEKPTIVMLHPMFLDSTWLDSQFGDPRLDSGFNLIAFDMRVCGRSTCRPSGLHDSWVEAADLAFIYHVSHPLIRSTSVEPIYSLKLQALHLPPAHILALENTSTNCAIRFATLCVSFYYLLIVGAQTIPRFPELCLSLTLCNIPPPTE